MREELSSVFILNEREKTRLLVAFTIGVSAMAVASWLAEVQPKLYAFLVGAAVVYVLMRPVDHRPQEVRDAEREAWVKFRAKIQKVTGDAAA